MGDYKAPEMSFRNRETKDRLTFNVFNGELYFQIWGNSGTKVHSEKFGITRMRLFQQVLTKIKAGSPGDKESLNFSKFDFKGDKKWVPTCTIVIEKDNEQMFNIHVKVLRGDSGTVYSFKLQDSGGVTVGGENMTKSQSSLEAVQSFLWWLDKIVPNGMESTKEKFTGNFGGNKGGGTKPTDNGDMLF